MGALGDDAVVAEEDDAVAGRQQRRARGDDDRGGAVAQAPDARGDARLGHRVDRRRRLVQHQDGRGGRERAGQGDALALPAGERPAALADLAVEAAGDRADGLVGAARVEDRGQVVHGPGRRQDVVADGAGEERRVVVGDEDQAARVVQRQVRGGPAVDAQGAGWCLAAVGEQVDQRGRGGGIGGDDAEVLARGDLQARRAGGGGGDREGDGGRDGLGAPASRLRGARVLAVRRGLQERRDAVGGGARLGQQGAREGQALQRADEELRQADRGDELADADGAVEREAPADPGDDREERAADEDVRAEQQVLGDPGADGGVEGATARDAVALGAGALRADALQDPQARRQVGRHARGLGGARLVDAAAALERPREELQRVEERRRAEEDEQPERQRRREQHRGRHDDRGDRGPADAHGLEDVDGAPRVGARDRHLRAGGAADVGPDRARPRGRGDARGGEDPAGQRGAQVVLAALEPADERQQLHPVGRGQEREEQGEHHDPEDELAGVAALDRPVDEHADQDGDEGLAGLVDDPAEGRDDGRATALAQDLAQQRPAPGGGHGGTVRPGGEGGGGHRG